MTFSRQLRLDAFHDRTRLNKRQLGFATIIFLTPKYFLLCVPGLTDQSLTAISYSVAYEFSPLLFHSDIMSMTNCNLSTEPSTVVTLTLQVSLDTTQLHLPSQRDPDRSGESTVTQKMDARPQSKAVSSSHMKRSPRPKSHAPGSKAIDLTNKSDTDRPGLKRKASLTHYQLQLMHLERMNKKRLQG